MHICKSICTCTYTCAYVEGGLAPNASASKPRLTGDQARFGVTASQRKYAAEVELWMADSVAALGAHNAGAYQGYLHERDAPEALYGELGVARLQVRLGLKLTPRGV